MDVTKDNFVELLPIIKDSIRSAEFIGFDTEFSGITPLFLNLFPFNTGLNIGYGDKQHDYDTVEDRYQKLKHNCSRMNTFQVGFATYHWDEDS